MRPRAASAVLAALLAGLAVAASAEAASTGTPEQISWVRRAATRFIAAELAGSGSEACAVLEARLRSGDCASRWNSRLAAMLRHGSVRAGLRADRRAVAHASVRVHGNTATVALPSPLLSGQSRFVWTEMCWMLER